MDDEVEAVAMAFYALQDCARGWEREPERLKDSFRNEARAAIAILELGQQSETVADH